PTRATINLSGGSDTGTHVLIPGLELVPQFVGVTEPLPELCGRYDVREPKVERCPLPGDASGPQPIDEDTLAIVPFDRLVDPLDPDNRPSRFAPPARANIDRCSSDSSGQEH